MHYNLKTRLFIIIIYFLSYNVNPVLKITGLFIVSFPFKSLSIFSVERNFQ